MFGEESGFRVSCNRVTNGVAIEKSGKSVHLEFQGVGSFGQTGVLVVALYQWVEHPGDGSGGAIQGRATVVRRVGVSPALVMLYMCLPLFGYAGDAW